MGDLEIGTYLVEHGVNKSEHGRREGGGYELFFNPGGGWREEMGKKRGMGNGGSLGACG